LLIHSNIGDTILDPFGGSFSTAIACHDERRNFIGSEINEKHFDKAYKRLRIHVRQLDLFK
jgi:DNA modification methylase